MATYGSASPTRRQTSTSVYIEERGWQRSHLLIVMSAGTATAFCGSAISSVPLILDELGEEFSVDRGALGLVVGCTMLGAIIGVLIGGAVGDALGRKLGLILVLVFATIAALLHLAVVRLSQLAAVRFLVGVAVGALLCIKSVYLSEVIPQDSRGFGITIGGLGWNFGALYGKALAWFFHGSWRFTLAGSFVPAVLAILLIAVFFSESPKWLTIESRAEETRAALHGIYGHSPAVMENPRGSAESLSLRARLQRLTPTARILAFLCGLLWVCDTGSTYIWGLWGPTGLKLQLGLEEMPYTIFIIEEIIHIVVAILIAFALDKFAREYVVMFGALLIAALIGLFVFVPPIQALVIGLYICIGIPWDAVWPAKIVLTTECFETELRGTMLGICQSGGRAFAAFAPVGVGILIDQIGVRALLTVSALMVLAAAVAYLIQLKAVDVELYK